MNNLYICGLFYYLIIFQTPNNMYIRSPFLIFVLAFLFHFSCQAQNKDKQDFDEYLNTNKYGCFQAFEGEILVVHFWINAPKSKKWFQEKLKPYGKTLSFTYYDYPISEKFTLKKTPEIEQQNDPISEILGHFNFETEKDFLDDLDKKVGKSYDNIIIAINLDKEGRSFAEFSTTFDNGDFYLEYFNFFTSFNGVSALDESEAYVVPHEMIHLAGAMDLYEEESTDPNYKYKTQIVREKYPKSIMYGNSEIPLKDMDIDEFTAYSIGISDNCKPHFPKIYKVDKFYKLYLENLESSNSKE